MSVAVDQSKTLIAGLPYLGSFAFANLPPAASWSGYTAIVSDVGVAPGMLLVSDGTRWAPLGPQVLARSAAQVAAPGDTLENTLATISVPAGLLGINGRLRLQSRWDNTNNANVKTARLRFSGGAGTILAAVALANAAQGEITGIVANRGLSNSQYTAFTTVFAIAGATSPTPVITAVDTTAATSLVLTAQKATAGDSMTLESYCVEILP